MICQQICRKCQFVYEISDPEYDSDSNIVVFPSVTCLNEGLSDIVVRFFREEPPKWCPFVVEHTIALSGQNANGSFWGPEDEKQTES
jgi:hypothetical protein